MVYLDDIIIFATSLQEHMCRLRQVFERLREAQLKVQLDKSEFLKQELMYLGHVITPHGIRPNPDKIRAIKQFPIPKTPREIKSFLGLVGYYRKFVPNMAKLTKPMTSLLKKNAKFEHTPDFIEAFEKCKELLINPPILQYPDFDQPFILTTDASNIALGAVLSQNHNGQDLPIAYASRTLNETETKYSVTDKELLSLVWSTKYFRPYLYGHKFIIRTDHQPLKWLFNLKDNVNSRLTRWKIKLSEYDFTVEYKKGKSNTNADALSRIEIHPIETDSMQVNIDESQIDPAFESLLKELENLDNGTLNTPTPSLLNLPVRENQNQVQDDQTVRSINDDDVTGSIPILSSPINPKKTQIRINTVIMNPGETKVVKSHGRTIINMEITINNAEKELLDLLKEYTNDKQVYFVYTDMDSTYRALCNVYTSHFHQNVTIIRCTKLLPEIENQEDQLEIIKNYHESKTNHRGVKETTSRLKTSYYWTNMRPMIEEYIRNCEICKRAKYDRHPPNIPMMITETPVKPFQILHTDTITIENKTYLTIIDTFTKLAQAIEIPNKTALTIADAFINYFSYYGTPESITADNGTGFKSDIIQQLLQLHKIKIHFITPYNPNSNGPIERFHLTLLEHIRLFKEQTDEQTSNLIKYAVIAYNSTIHNATGYTPYELTFGHSDRKNIFDLLYDQPAFSNYIANHKDKMALIYQSIHAQSSTQKDKIAQRVNKELTQPQDKFKTGDTVYEKSFTSVRHKTKKRFNGPYQITKINPDNTCEITNKSKHITKRTHTRNLQKTSVAASTSRPAPDNE